MKFPVKKKWKRGDWVTLVKSIPGFPCAYRYQVGQVARVDGSNLDLILACGHPCMGVPISYVSRVTYTDRTNLIGSS